MTLAEAGVRRTRKEVRFETERAYWSVARLREQREVARRTVATLDQHVERIEILAPAGRARQLDLLQVESKRGEVQLLLFDLENRLAAAELQLKSLLGLPSGTELQLVETTVSTARAPDPTRETVEVTMARLRVEAKDRKARAARGALLPRVSAVAGYTYSNPNERYFPPANAFNGSWDVALIAQWQWDGGTALNRAREMETEVEVARLDLANVKDQIDRTTTIAAHDLEDARRRIDVHRQRVRSTTAAFELATLELEAGRGTHNEVADASLELARAEANLVDAHIAIRLAEARLRYLVAD